MSGTTNERIPSYDLLRILSALAVVCLHVAGPYGGAAAPGEGAHYATVGVFFHSVTRFAVPCFFMLSGAFLLCREENGDFLPFYRKSLRRLGIPAAACTGLYLGCRLLAGHGAGTGFSGVPASVWKDLAEGRIYYHMWYVSVLAGLYLIVPLLVRLRGQLGRAAWERLAWVWMFWSVASGWTSSPPLAWDIGNAFSYGGYFAMGSVLCRGDREPARREAGSLLPNARAALCLAGAAVLLCLTALLQWRYRDGWILGLSPVSNFSPAVAAASLLLFTAFGGMRWRGDLSRAASRTFWVYLLHPLALECLGVAYARRFPARPDPVWWIPACTLLVFGISYGMAAFLTRLGEKGFGRRGLT